jgi:CRISPR/Cas system-associated exonuclease Cas4 (RecB family)
MNIESAYNDYLVHLESKRERTKNKFHASSAGSCFRKQMYNYFDFPQSVKDNKSYRLLRLGTIIHEDIENAIMHCQNSIEGRVYIENEIEIPELNLVGTYDLGQLVKQDDGYTIFNLYDIKSAAMYTWQKMFGQIKNRKPGTDDNYKMQLATYALAINEELSPDKMNMYLVWYKKNDSHWKEVLVSPDWIEKAIEYWTELNSILEDCGESFEEDLIPEYWDGVPFKQWECSYCPYYDLCPSTIADKRRK